MKRITTAKETVLDLLEKGKLINLVELRTGKNNSGSGINKINQLRTICKYFDIPLENYVRYCNTSKLRNRRNFFIFLNKNLEFNQNIKRIKVNKHDKRYYY